MNIYVIGSNGQLGNEIRSIYEKNKSEIGLVEFNLKENKFIFLDKEDIDICKIENIYEVFEKENPDVIINCAAYTNVDNCETDIDMAFKVNAIGSKNLAIAGEKYNSKLIHVSTDYVFSGDGEVPYREYDITIPSSVYGKTKLMGEEYVKQFSSRYFIVRTAWLYGYIGNNFVKTIMKISKEKEEIKVVDDQRGNPTNANDLAHHIIGLVGTENYGIYHCVGKGECSWYDFAKEIVEQSGISCKVHPCTTEEYPRPAKRPSYSCLDNMMFRSTIGDSMRDWKIALKDFISKI